ncbi:hypothetical protein AG0111_0g12255 [Alternaria gaisen]|uniref:Uncharacterized protein n=1 Tax=Alternaria gaisen TaxID=167740 RepID=A0ACB6F4R9_9PLEO|nr:hypothetical protein AG0111_0g12255 [Alternaria gaisen]
MQALVCGIIGNVVSEQVLQRGFFGGIEEGVQQVTEVEKDTGDSDGEYINSEQRSDKKEGERGKGRLGIDSQCTAIGFDRKIKHAAVIRSYLPTPIALPANFNAHVNIIVGALYTHLSPFLALVTPDNTPTLPTLFPHLQTLVISAGLLSLHMSLSPHTIYHHVPLFKEDTYVSSSMECFNERAMRLSNMRTSLSGLPSLSFSSSPSSFRPTQEELQQERARRNRLNETEKRRAGGNVPLVQIVCTEGITAYRRGGCEKNKTSSNENPVFEKSGYQNMGIRARILTHGWTYCRWGRARSSSDSMQNPACRDVENTGRKIHGDVWRDGGFVNFSDVEGVMD